jgi:cobalt-zinc-cadmium efflux system membrane fusion protein
MKNSRHALYLLCIAALLVAMLASCGTEAPEHEEDSAHEDGAHEDGAHEDPEHDEGVVELTPEAAARAGIRTAPVVERVMEGELSTTGQVDFDQARLAHVSPRITGRVHRVHARLGESVRAGETLAEIDSIELGRTKAEFLQARARQELAKKNYERERRLFADRISSEKETLTAEAELREATATLLTVEETLHLYGLDQEQVEALGYDDPTVSIYPLRAPFAGTIVERHATLGELVTPERNLFTLADLGRVWIWVDVYQRDLGRVHLDDEVRTRVDAYPGEVFAGTVSFLSAQVEPETRTVRARIDVANPGGKLRPGMFVEVDLSDPHADEGGEIRPASRVVPEGAVQRDGDTHFVFVAAPEPGGISHRFERRDVRAGRRAGGWVEITGGLETGAEVVVEGAFVLKSAAAKDSLGEGHAH